jgi:hypothetical protein
MVIDQLIPFYKPNKKVRSEDDGPPHFSNQTHCKCVMCLIWFIYFIALLLEVKFSSDVIQSLRYFAILILGCFSGVSTIVLFATCVALGADWALIFFIA